MFAPRRMVILFAVILSVLLLVSADVQARNGGRSGGGFHAGGFHGGGYRGGVYHGWHGGYRGPYFGLWGVGVWPYPYGYAYPYYDPYYGYPYSYPNVYEYPPDAQLPVQNEPQQSYWYYCKDPQGYYPYVQNCPGGWTEVLPTPPQSEKESVTR